MTVSTADLREEYTATAGQTVFTFDFRVFGNADVKVYQTPAGVDFDDATYLITAYTMTPNADQDANQGGVVTLNSGATIGDRITIISNVSETRTTDYKDGGVFDPDLVDNDMDRSLSIAKQAKESISLAPRFSESAHGVAGVQLPTLTPNTFWKVNGTGTGLDAVTIDGQVVANGIPLSNYAALRAYDSSSLTDGQIFTLSDNGGYFVVKSGLVVDDGFNLIVFADDSLRYAERIHPAYNNDLSLKNVIDNQIPLIEGSGQTFDPSSDDQIHKSVANYSVVNFEAGDSGGANTIVLTLGSGRETLSSLTQCSFVFEVNTTNTGATTVDSSLILGQSAGTTIDDLRDVNDAALSGGELVAGMMAHVAFNATTGRWQLLNPSASIQLQTVVATTSGTSIDFTGIPSGVNRVTITLDSVSLDANFSRIFQLGDSGGVETSGYEGSTYEVSSGSVSLLSSSFAVTGDANAALSVVGKVVFERCTGNVWTCVASLAPTATSTLAYGINGVKELSGELTTVRLTSSSGTANFDGGQAAISWEY